MKPIKSIELVLENVDSIIIDGKNIGRFIMRDIHKSAQIAGCNSFAIFETAKFTAIEIHNKANVEHLYGNFLHDGKVFERLTRTGDIVWIEIHYHDNTMEKFYVEWDDGEYVNSYQTSFVNDEGNLFIVISEDKTAKDFFVDTEAKFWERCDWGEGDDPGPWVNQLIKKTKYQEVV